MSAKNLEKLLRMAHEVELLERDACGNFQTAGGSLRRTGWKRVASVVSFAAAAALAALFVGPPKNLLRDHGSSGGEAEFAVGMAAGIPALAVCRQPADSITQRLTVDRFEADSAGEPAYLLALTRTWNRDCDCLLWDLQRWADGAMLAASRGSETLELDVATGQSNAFQQVLVLAVAPERSSFAHTASDSGAELLNCLNSRDLPPTGEQADATYAKALESCLPSGVTFVSHSLASR